MKTGTEAKLWSARGAAVVIRRDMAGAGPGSWVLIPQVEHAHLAGQLARRWSPPIGPDGCLPEIQAAIDRHDDGWIAWDAAPQVDLQEGRPLAFDEMPIEVSLEIWTRSIEGARELGPLAAWLVAAHFVNLVGGSGGAGAPAARTWAADIEGRCAEWLEAWERADAARHRRSAASRALAFLQVCDLLSLWLCMAERARTESFELPDGRSLRLTPRAGGTFTAGPWPFLGDRAVLSVRGREVRATRYDDAAALAAAKARPVELAWQFLPGADHASAGPATAS